MMKRENKSCFWRIYLVCTASVLVLLTAALAVFYDYIRAYENSQPINAAECFAAALTDDEISKWIDTAAAGLESEYESSESIAAACRSALMKLEKNYECRKDHNITDSTSYRVYRDDVLIGRIMLQDSGNGKYGFSSWEVVQGEVFLEEFCTERYSVTVCIPGQGEEIQLTVNGKPVSPDDLITDKAAYRFASPFEQSAGITAKVYYIDRLYAEPDIQCTAAGISCAKQRTDDEIWFLYPEKLLYTYTITVPQGSVLKINGVTADDSYRTAADITYAYADVEVSLADLPKAQRYTVSGLWQNPGITASFQGIPLRITQENTSFRADYPEELLYTAKIRVPAGSTVTMRGVSCTPYKSPQNETAYPELFENEKNAPLYDVYLLEKLFVQPEIPQIIYNGNPLACLVTEDGQYCEFSALYPEVNDSEVQGLALAFATDYFNYIAYGYRNTAENLSRALQHVKKGSELYSRIQRSRVGIDYVTPASSQIFHTLSAEELRSMPDGSVYCLIDFDIEQTIYQIKRSYRGTLSLMCSRVHDTWYITGMHTENENS